VRPVLKDASYNR